MFCNNYCARGLGAMLQSKFESWGMAPSSICRSNHAGSISEASEFTTSAYFLSQRGDNLVLDIESDKSKRAICFVSEFDGIRFESWRAFSLFKSIRSIHIARFAGYTIYKPWWAN